MLKTMQSSFLGPNTEAWEKEDALLQTMLNGSDGQEDSWKRYWSCIEAHLPAAADKVDRIVSKLRAAETGASAQMVGAEAHENLNVLRDRLLEREQPFIRQLSSSTWLWYLRRVDPMVIGGRLATTPVNVMRVAENLSTFSRRSMLNDRVATETPFRFEMTAARARMVAEMLAIAGAVNLLENHIRRAAKGQAFDFSQAGIPEVIDDSYLQNALDSFDSRSTIANSIPWHPNINYGSAPSEMQNALALASRTIGGWEYVDGWIQSSSGIEKAQVFGQFSLDFSTLSKTTTNIDLSGSAAGMRNPEIAACLVALSNAVARYVVGMPHAGLAVPAFGYIIVHHDDLLDFLQGTLDAEPWLPLNEIWSHLSPKHVLKKLKRHPGPGGPSAGGAVVRTCLVGHMIDLSSLSRELTECVRVDPSFGGPWVNAGAFDFEVAVQQMINLSRYCPSQTIGDLRGVTLLGVDGPVTDIDAIIEFDSKLILVSCKKIEFSQDFDKGEYRRTKNNESVIVSALSEWKEKVSFFRGNPRGRNYDFSEFDDIAGIVVSPSTVFLSDPTPLEPSDDLPSNFRKHMSYGELVRAVFVSD